MKVLIFLIIIFSTNVFAGEKGNGGDVVFCDNPTPQQKAIELLDYYEGVVLAEEGDPKIDLGEESLSYQEKFEILVSRIAKYSPARANLYRKWAVEFFNEAELVTEELPQIPDSLHVFLPSGCQLRQIVIQQSEPGPGEFRYKVSQQLWDMLDNEGRAGLLLHEFLYRDAVTFGQNDSRRSRAINYRFARNIIFESLNSYLRFFESYGFLTEELTEPSGIIFKVSISEFLKGNEYDYRAGRDSCDFYKNGDVKGSCDFTKGYISFESAGVVSSEKFKVAICHWRVCEFIGPSFSWILKDRRYDQITSLKFGSYENRFSYVKFYFDGVISSRLKSGREIFFKTYFQTNTEGEALGGVLVNDLEFQISSIKFVCQKDHEISFTQPMFDGGLDNLFECEVNQMRYFSNDLQLQVDLHKKIQISTDGKIIGYLNGNIFGDSNHGGTCEVTFYPSKENQNIPVKSFCASPTSILINGFKYPTKKVFFFETGEVKAIQASQSISVDWPVPIGKGEYIYFTKKGLILNVSSEQNL
jgi:hypothetical protein